MSTPAEYELHVQAPAPEPGNVWDQLNDRMWRQIADAFGLPLVYQTTNPHKELKRA